jgi:hypothetical protein
LITDLQVPFGVQVRRPRRPPASASSKRSPGKTR